MWKIFPQLWAKILSRISCIPFTWGSHDLQLMHALCFDTASQISVLIPAITYLPSLFARWSLCLMCNAGIAQHSDSSLISSSKSSAKLTIQRCHRSPSDPEELDPQGNTLVALVTPQSHMVNSFHLRLLPEPGLTHQHVSWLRAPLAVIKLQGKN